MKNFIVIFGVLLPVWVSAQGYSINWHKIGGGGGTSTGGGYQASGTIGQHDAGGPMTGGGYSLDGGFWTLISVIQTFGAPALFIRHSGDTVTVFWQAVPGWKLQQNSDLTKSAGWSASTGITTSGGTNYLDITPPLGDTFFRLSNP